ncbi:MAG: translation initiation factor IF-3 [Verrucomicrobiia bacterium]
MTQFRRWLIAPSVRINNRIRAREVRLIDKDGNHLGVMPLRDALAMAQQRGLDVVEVSPNATPSVCKLLEYGKFRYEQTKQEREARKHSTSWRIKQVKFHVNISEHDYQIKVRHVAGFLEKHMKTKVSLMFRGREMAHQELGMQIMQRLAKEVQPYGVVESAPKMIGRSIHMVISPLSGKDKPISGSAAAPVGLPESGGRVMAVEVKAAPVSAPPPVPASSPAQAGRAPLSSLEMAFNRAQGQKTS